MKRVSEKLTVQWRRFLVAAEGKDAVNAIALPVRIFMLAAAGSLVLTTVGICFFAYTQWPRLLTWLHTFSG